MTQPLPPPGWYPDPSGSSSSRWWDGQGWRDSVHDASPPPVPALRDHPAGRPLREQPVLVVAREAKLIELRKGYAVSDGQGRRIGAVVQVGGGAPCSAAGPGPRLGRYLASRLEVRDAGGPVLVLTRPARIGRFRMQVSRPDGAPVGEVVKANALGRLRFDLVAGGQVVGAVRAENWRARDLAVLDGAGTEVARITRRWTGIARTLSGTGDEYAVHVPLRLPEPLADLVIASTLALDTALRQD